MLYIYDISNLRVSDTFTFTKNCKIEMHPTNAIAAFM